MILNVKGGDAHGAYFTGLPEGEKIKQHVLEIGASGLIKQRIAQDCTPGVWERKPFIILRFYLIDPVRFQQETGWKPVTLGEEIREQPDSFQHKEGSLILDPESLDNRISPRKKPSAKAQQAKSLSPTGIQRDSEGPSNVTGNKSWGRKILSIFGCSG